MTEYCSDDTGTNYNERFPTQRTQRHLVNAIAVSTKSTGDPYARHMVWLRVTKFDMETQVGRDVFVRGQPRGIQSGGCPSVPNIFGNHTYARM